MAVIMSTLKEERLDKAFYKEYDLLDSESCWREC